MASTKRFFPGVCEFLARHFGARFWFDNPEETELVIEVRAITRQALLDALSEYGEAIRSHLHCQRQRAMSIFVGGPLNGQRHAKFGSGTPITIHLGRGRWAAYVIGDDHLRAWFCGIAPSRRKAGILIYRASESARGQSR